MKEGGREYVRPDRSFQPGGDTPNNVPDQKIPGSLSRMFGGLFNGMFGDKTYEEWLQDKQNTNTNTDDEYLGWVDSYLKSRMRNALRPKRQKIWDISPNKRPRRRK